MNSDDNNNHDDILWAPKKSTISGQQANNDVLRENTIPDDIPPLFQNDASSSEPSVDELKKEIDNLLELSSDDISLNEANFESGSFSPKYEESGTPLTQTLEHDIQGDIMKSNHEALLQNLRESIDSDFNAIENNIEAPTAKGVENTYYQDVSDAMSANDPKTMAELIQKSRFEEEEAKVLSPRSKKNLFFIGGALLLLVFSIGILSLIFGGSGRKVQFISGERVASVVYSNQDTGINVTGLEASQTRQAIRRAVEQRIPRDTVNQIYYAEAVGGNVMRRLSISETFVRSDNTPPSTLMNALEDEFMHGVYNSDRNHPFLILKTRSYDRAFEGMKEWEPRMIDDLAAYLDLPAEASDRSLIEDGFEDDLIRNKTARVARFLPREADRRGILRFLDSFLGNNQSANESTEVLQTTSPNNELNESGVSGEGVLGVLQKNLLAMITPTPAYAQGWSSFQSGSGSTQLVCYNNNFPGQTFPSEYQGTPGYYCVSVLVGEGPLGQLSFTDDVCFNIVTGERLPQGTGNPATDFCFPSYQCNAYRCFIGNTEVNSNQEGNPGVVCRETNELVTHDAPGRKICRQFNDLLLLQNINHSTICFDAMGQYLPNVTYPDGTMHGVTCISPHNRSRELCVTHSGQVYDPYGIHAVLYDANRKFCFQRLDGSTTHIGACGNLTLAEIQARLAATAHELQFVGLLYENVANMLAVFGVNVSMDPAIRMYEISGFLMDIAHGNILDEATAAVIYNYLLELELMLVTIQEIQNLLMQFQVLSGPSEALNMYDTLYLIIDTIRCALGLHRPSLQWITMEPLNPDLYIYAGQSLPEVEPIQQFLVLSGLMDPISVTGTLDLVTQDAISQFQLANALEVTGTVNPETILIINAIIEGQGALYAGEGIINDYLSIPTAGSIGGSATIMLGTYLQAVQTIQIVLYAEGYDILTINGFFDQQTCAAMQAFQEDNGLEIADDTTCTVSPETLEAINDLIRGKGYLGSGFYLNPQGFLEGVGELSGTFGPGVFDYTVSEADADTLREGDIVLMYMFLDEETILITRSQVVIDEVIRRRALSDIFQI